MRIVCPNCAAEYEVDAALIPYAGRDVQCSSCGHAWFVAHPDDAASEESELALFDPPPASAAAPALAAPRQVDQAILDVLREEAARETAQRQAEARTGIEDQPDLGLDTMGPGPTVAAPTDEVGETVPLSPVSERIARLKGQPSSAPSNAAIETPSLGKRSDLLPEIDQINSSLRPAAEKRPGAAAAVAKSMPRKGGFGRGFLVGLLLWVMVLVTYTLAPELSRRIPAIAPALTSFVTFIDGLRSAIADLGHQLVEMLGKLTK